MLSGGTKVRCREGVSGVLCEFGEGGLWFLDGRRRLFGGGAGVSAGMPGTRFFAMEQGLFGLGEGREILLGLMVIEAKLGCCYFV
jgi:hypothetical protein